MTREMKDSGIEWVGKIPINRLALLGVVDGKKDEYDKEELNNET